MFDKDALIAALRMRYDFYSAQSMFELARDRAGLADKPALDATELHAFRAALSAVGDRVERVLAHLDELLASAPGGAAPKRIQDAPSAPVEKPAAAPAEKPAAAAAEKPAAVAAEKPAAEKPAAEKPAAEKPAAEKPAAVAAEKPAAVAAEKPAAEKPAAEKPAPAASAAAAPIETTIVLSGLEVADGEEVLVCGAYAQLGDWDPDRARPMSRKGDQWLATIELAPDTKVAFKFLRRDADGKLIWETGDDRMLVGAQRLDATWR